MIRRLVAWALDSLLIVIFAAIVGAAAGVHAFLNINVEAYPDPAPAIVEVIAQWPGASAEAPNLPRFRSHARASTRPSAPVDGR